MDQQATHRYYMLLAGKAADGYRVSHSVVYGDGDSKVKLSAELSQQIIQHGIRWLSGQTDEFNAYEDQVYEELYNAKDGIMSGAQIIPDIDIMEQKRFSLN